MEAMLNSPLGRTILGPTRVTIGCTSDNQVVLQDAGVESRHAEILPEGQGYSVRDLGSNAGTFINEQRLAPNVPRQLQNGDALRIGNTTFSYEVTSGPAIAQTVYAASPGQVGDLGQVYSPTVMAPGGDPILATNYGAPSQSGAAYYAPPPPMPGGSAGPPPPPVVGPGYNIDNPYASATPKKRGRRGLWITLGVLGGIFVIFIFLFIIAGGGGPSMTPTQAYQAYCAALKAHNSQAAFNMYSTNAKQQLQLTQEKVAAIANSISDCTVSNVDNTTTAGSITFTFIGIGNLTDDDKLTSSEDNVWKIDAQQQHPSPTYTLFNLCNDLVKGDYHTAYGLYTNAYQSKMTEADYTKSFTSGQPTKCDLSNVSDSAKTGVVTLTFGTVSTMLDEILTNENGAWKIDSEQQHSTPTLTLNTYCDAIKQKDYQTAYNQFTGDNQSSLPEAQFEKNISDSNISDCTVSNVDDNAGTGTIAYTTASGPATMDYTLVQENGTWKIKTEKAH